MDSVDASSLVLSAFWSFGMVWLVVKLDEANGYESGLKDVFSMPIISSLFIAGTYVYLTYEPIANKTNDLGGSANRINHFFSASLNAIFSTLSIWGTLLMFVAIYHFIKKHFPHEVQELKEKIMSWFGR